MAFLGKTRVQAATASNQAGPPNVREGKWEREKCWNTWESPGLLDLQLAVTPRDQLREGPTGFSEFRSGCLWFHVKDYQRGLVAFLAWAICLIEPFCFYVSSSGIHWGRRPILLNKSRRYLLWFAVCESRVSRRPLCFACTESFF